MWGQPATALFLDVPRDYLPSAGALGVGGRGGRGSGGGGGGHGREGEGGAGSALARRETYARRHRELRMYSETETRKI